MDGGKLCHGLSVVVARMLEIVPARCPGFLTPVFTGWCQEQTSHLGGWNRVVLVFSPKQLQRSVLVPYAAPGRRKLSSGIFPELSSGRVFAAFWNISYADG